MRPSVVVSLGMLAACGGLAYLHETRDEPDAAASTAPAQRSSTNQSPIEAPGRDTTTAPDTGVDGAAGLSSSNVTDTAAATSAPGRPDTVEQWIKDTQDSDPKIRAAAIAKLANAPKAQALPALKNVLETGEPEVDRHIALNSLHTLALRDGDSNGQVRDVMRRAIYHSDNDDVTQSAQSLLDDVEAALAEQQPQSN
jgi:hypothetical protein